MKYSFRLIGRFLFVFVVGVLLSGVAFLSVWALFDIFDNKVMTWLGYIASMAAALWVAGKVLKKYHEK